MIWESGNWKEDLFLQARRVRRRQNMKRWGERTTAGLEKDLMIGFYSIRKLIEAHTVSDEIRDRSISLVGYPWTGSPGTFMNWDKVDEKYDLEHPEQFERQVIWIANQMIHSFVFLPCFDEDSRLDSILFNSDRTRRLHVYSMPVNWIISLFEEVAANDPASMVSHFKEKTGDYEVRVGPTMELCEAASNPPPPAEG